MRCEVSERELSARLDGEVDRGLEAALDEHLGTCPSCRAFQEGGRRLREVVRLQPAAPVPDLVPEIMAAVREEALRARRLPDTRRPRGLLPPGWARPAAALVAGFVAAVLLLGGLPVLRRPGPAPALATEIPRLVVQAARGITTYRATFEIEEQNFREEVPLRRLVSRVAFGAPEGFHVVVRDLTSYPSVEWPRNDLSLTVDGGRWSVAGPATCPRESLPACPTVGRDERAVRGREPFDGDAPLPTDIVLPVRTLSGSDRVEVVGEGSVLGRATVVLRLAYADAVPLFAYLQAGGLWRPFFPRDEVLVSLDRETWFPLAYEVRPAGSAERDAWAQRHGLPPEPPGQRVFHARALSFDPSPGRVRIPPPPATGARDAGFRDVHFDELARESGLEPLVPSRQAGLEPYRAGIFVAEGRPPDEVLLSYTKGLAWLKIRQTARWPEPALYGDVGALASPIDLPGGGIAYYEPATATLGRRLSIHAEEGDLYLESNLPLPRLLEVAGSLPVRGIEVPDEWLERRWRGGSVREQVPIEQAIGLVPDLLLPTHLPPDYRLWTNRVVLAGEEVGVTTYFRRPGAELEGIGIRLHQAPGAGLPPPMDPDVVAVLVRGVTGRYSPTRGELEWVEDGVYRSLRAATLDLAGLLRIAESLADPAEALEVVR